MPALYSHTTRAVGTTLTASIYNTDHLNHITNGVPAQLDDYSSTVAEMQTNTDPGELGSESQATSLAGELERLRFAIKEIKTILDATITQWYQTPQVDSGLMQLPPWYIDGLEISVAAGGVGVIGVATGVCRDAADTINMRVSSPMTRTVTALYTSTVTGGAIAGSTWTKFLTYHVFVIKTAASVIDFGVDTVITASNLLVRASGTKYRRIGSVLCATTAGTLRGLKQNIDDFMFLNPQFTNTSHVALSATVAGPLTLVCIPLGVKMQANVHMWTTDTGGWYARDVDVTVGAYEVQAMYGATTAGRAFQMIQNSRIWTDVSGKIGVDRGGIAVVTAVKCLTLGWKDMRR